MVKPATLPRVRRQPGAGRRGGGATSRARQQTSIRQVLGLTRRRDRVSVAEVALVTRLSKTTVKKTLDLLAEMKLVVSAGKGSSTEEGGKKPELYRFNRTYGYVVSVHLTPDALIAVTTDLHGDITSYRKSEVGAERELPLILSRIAEDVRAFQALKAASGEKLVALCLALPGPTDAARGLLVYSPHYPSWGRNVPIAQKLRELLGPGFEVPMYADCVNRLQTLAEREKGVASGITNFMIVDVLDEGLGAGIVTHGELMRGTQGLAGEIGHMTVNPLDGPVCICGNRGCFEAMVSASRVCQLVREARSRGVESSVHALARDGKVSLADVFAEAARGDALCTAILDDVARWFQVGLGNTIMVNDPELIVLQGQYVQAGGRFLAKLRQGIQQIGLPDVEKKVRIEYSKLGEERGALGGAALAIAEFFGKRQRY